MISYQLSMSEAIVKVNELKSSLHQQTLSEYEISEAIIDIEVLSLYYACSFWKES